jgi:hypothetical protein
MSSLFFLLESLSRLRKTKIYMFSGGACIFASLVVLASLKRASLKRFLVGLETCGDLFCHTLGASAEICQTLLYGTKVQLLTQRALPGSKF